MSDVDSAGSAPALLAAVLVSCSLIGIAYSNADQWLLYQAGHYLDLRDGQREQLGKALGERLAEHRTRELADYVDFLDRVQRAAADGLDAAEVEPLVTRLEGLARTTVAGTLPAMADVLAKLQPDQIDHLKVALEEDDRRYRKGSVQPTAQRRVDRQVKRAVGALEFWTGDLSEAQRARVVALVRTLAGRGRRVARVPGRAHRRARRAPARPARLCGDPALPRFALAGPRRPQ